MKWSRRHLSDGKAYVFYSQFVPLVARGFFRKIYLHRIRELDAERPILLASNHPTAFLEPIVMGAFAAPPLYNMTRGDLFAKPIFYKLMRGFNMFPVFRLRDGYRHSDRNDAVFEYCIGKLQEGKIVTIYVEGEHHADRRVKPVQKGIARIAFEAYHKHGMRNMAIVPAGANFRYGDRYRDYVMINFGDPIALDEYADLYASDPGAAMLRLTRELHAALKALCLHVEDPDDDKLAERLLELHRNATDKPALPIVRHSDKWFRAEKAITDRLNELPLPRREALRAAAADYFDALKRERLDDEGLYNRRRFLALKRIVFLTLGFPLFAAGFLLRAPIAYAFDYIIRTKIKKREFKSSVLFALHLLVSPLYYIALILAAAFTANPYIVAAALAAPLLGWISVSYREVWREFFNALKATLHPQRDAFLAMREQVWELFEKGVEDGDILVEAYVLRDMWIGFTGRANDAPRQ